MWITILTIAVVLLIGLIVGFFFGVYLSINSSIPEVAKEKAKYIKSSQDKKKFNVISPTKQLNKLNFDTYDK